jgi:hypothetical protein
MIRALQEFQALNGVQDDGANNLDPNLPLMQLFLQTLMPWNDIDRR